MNREELREKALAAFYAKAFEETELPSVDAVIRVVLEAAAEVAEDVSSPYDVHAEAPSHGAFCDGADAANEAIRALIPESKT